MSETEIGDEGAALAILAAIDEAVPRTIATQWREDICQDLAVAVLSGEIPLEDLRAHVGSFVKGAFRLLPPKYGPLSLDATDGADDRPLIERLSPTACAPWDAVPFRSMDAAYQRRWHAAHPGMKALYSRIHYWRRRDRIRVRKQTWYVAHREQRLVYQREYDATKRKPGKHRRIRETVSPEEFAAIKRRGAEGVAARHQLEGL